MSDALAETFRSIEKIYRGSIDDLNIGEIYLQSPYTIVELTNGSQGIAFNFDHEGRPFKLDDKEEKHNWAALGAELLNKSKVDNLLRITLLTDSAPKKHYELSVQVAILNALSQRQNTNNRYLRDEGLALEDYPVPLASLSKKGDVVSIIGLGTYFYQALYDPNVQVVLLSDFWLDGSSEMRERIGKFLGYFPGKLQFFSYADSESLVLKSDIACVNASALCNGTMDCLLRAARKGRCREAIVHGHGGGVLSAPLFERGVTMHVLSKVNQGFLAEAKKFVKKRQLPILSNVRTVLEEESFYDFIDVKLKSVTVSERPFSLGKARRLLQGKVTSQFRAARF